MAITRPTARAELTSEVFSDQEGQRLDWPFVGLRPFSFEDRGIFFGRSEQIDVLEQLIIHRPLVSVIGSSGSGKSSLIRAGLLPRLVIPGQGEFIAWRWIETRPGEEPIRRLAEALAMLGG